MRSMTAAATLLTLSWTAAAAADAFDELARNLTIARHGNVIVASAVPPETAAALARRISAYEIEIRRRHFPTLEARPIRFVVGENRADLEALAEAPAPGARTPDPFGYYRRDGRIVVASTAHGDGALLRELTRALLVDDNPHAPEWFETAMASLYESSEGHGAALAAVLDRRMAHIGADTELDADVFAGICDCYPASDEQLALMRLLLMHLYARGELASLQEVIERKGQYVTLLESLDAMGFDGAAWKRYAEQRVRTFRESGETSS